MFRILLSVSLLMSVSAFQSIPSFSPSIVRSRNLSVRQGLLKGIDPVLTAELLNILRSAGHGDIIAVVDCNYPAVQAAASTTTGELIKLAGVNIPDTIRAISSVMPVDFFVDDPLYHIWPSKGLEMPPLGKEVLKEAQAAIAENCKGAKFQPLERYEFYDKAKEAFAIVQSSERRPYGCFLIQKGVVGPDGKDLMP